MKAANTICSHFLQKAYQRRFATQDGYVWVVAKKDHSIRKLHVDSVCAQNGFYRYLDANGEIQDFETDSWLSDLEQDAPRLLQAASNSVLTEKDREVLATYMGLTALRTPSYRVCLLKTTIAAIAGLDVEAKVHPDSFVLRHHRDPMSAQTIIDLGRREMMMNPAVHVWQLRTEAPRLGKILANLTWKVLRTDDSAFLTTDTPLTIVFPTGWRRGYLGDPSQDQGERYFFPLQKQSCLMLNHEQPNINTQTVTRDDVAEINAYAINNSYQYVISPTPDLSSILPLGLSWLKGTPPQLKE